MQTKPIDTGLFLFNYKGQGFRFIIPAGFDFAPWPMKAAMSACFAWRRLLGLNGLSGFNETPEASEASQREGIFPLKSGLQI